MPSILPQQIKKDIKSGKTRKNEGRKEGSKDKKGGGRKKGKKKEGVVGTISHHRCLHVLHPAATNQERYKIRKDTKEGRKEGRKEVRTKRGEVVRKEERWEYLGRKERRNVHTADFRQDWDFK